jgi:hypothetical protein
MFKITVLFHKNWDVVSKASTGSYKALLVDDSSHGIWKSDQSKYGDISEYNW